LDEIKKVSQHIEKGGGEKYQNKIKDQGKNPVRERIRRLIDPGS
jgi:acetyl-CoA carboxylase carboxyltransferase component